MTGICSICGEKIKLNIMIIHLIRDHGYAFLEQPLSDLHISPKLVKSVFSENKK